MAMKLTQNLLQIGLYKKYFPEPCDYQGWPIEWCQAKTSHQSLPYDKK